MNPLSIAFRFMAEQSIISYKNKEKIEEARNLYFEARKYPRKKKKQLKKKALYDYSFWMSIEKWHNSLF